MNAGFLRVAAAVPKVHLADVEANVAEIIGISKELIKNKVEVAVFPEMSLTGYTCGDLFHDSTLLDAAEKGILKLAEFSTRNSMTIIVGAPLRCNSTLYNCAVAIEQGVIRIKGKQMVPNYNEFYEMRWWQPVTDDIDVYTIIGGAECAIETDITIATHGTVIGVEICEELWVPIPPSTSMVLGGATVIFNLSASDDITGKYDYLRQLVIGQSARCIGGYVYSGAGWGESSTDLVFDGKGIIAENGRLLAEKKRWDPNTHYIIADIDIAAIEHDRMHSNSFSACRNAHRIPLTLPTEGPVSDRFPTDLRREVNPRPFVPSGDAEIDSRAEEIVNIQAAGLCRRLDAIGCKSLVVGISGGLDSTLALLVAVKAFDRLGLPRKGILGITMPGFGTTDRTHDNAVALMRELGVDMKEISIVPAVKQHFADIGHDASVHDVTYENSQARERTQILMDMANRTGGIVLGTGDLSELALGWATYNGDHISMYGVNAGVPKTLVRYLVAWFARHADNENVARVLGDIIDTPISPELIPADSDGNITQKTEDLVGPYQLHDFFLYYIMRYGFTPRRIYNLALKAFENTEYTPEVILKWLRTFYRRFFNQQFKRSCMPDGPKVGSVALSPRGDWRMPSDASSRLWLAELENL